MYDVHSSAVCSHVLSPLCVGWKSRAGLKNGDEEVYFNAQRRGVHIPTLILRLSLFVLERRNMETSRLPTIEA